MIRVITATAYTPHIITALLSFIFTFIVEGIYCISLLLLSNTIRV